MPSDGAAKGILLESISRLEDETREMAEILAEYKVKFSHDKEKIDSLEKEVDALKPKGIDYAKFITIGLSILGMLVTGLWALSHKFYERPTNEVIQQIIVDHADKPIKDLIKVQQYQQRTLDKMDDKMQIIMDDVKDMKQTLKRR